MTTGGRPAIPVHVGVEPPEKYEARAADVAEFERTGQDYNREYLLRRPQVSRDVAELDHRSLNVEWRWIGQQSDDCVAAIEPGRFASGGATEFDRLRRGAVLRGEPVLVVKTLNDDPGPRIFGGAVGMWLADSTNLDGRPVGSGGRPSLAHGADPADLDLAKRVLTTRQPDGPWWALSLSGETSIRGDGSGSEHHPPGGTLQPLLVSNLGESVMAVWTSPDGELRIYVLPSGHDWSNTLRWLVEQGLPAHAPRAMRALRSSHAPDDPTFLSRAEGAALDGLRILETEYELRRHELSTALATARSAAEAVRDPMLFAQGHPLAEAVGQVFRSAGATVVDLDDEFGDSISADLLVEVRGVRALVEVKSANGPAPEALMDKLVKHLQTWPKLRPGIEVKRGVLVVSNDLRKPPETRPLEPFQRREFVASSQHAIVSTRQLLAWWLAEDWAAVRALVVEHSVGGDASPVADSSSRPRTPRWRRLRGG
ncbi:MAG: hypothetical protein ACT4QF_01520 [Sporichthyaceae bacterium]